MLINTAAGGLALLLLCLTLAGLCKPWWVLWWMPRQNRQKVLMYYGIALVVFGLVYWFGR